MESPKHPGALFILLLLIIPPIQYCFKFSFSYDIITPLLISLSPNHMRYFNYPSLPSHLNYVIIPVILVSLVIPVILVFSIIIIIPSIPVTLVIPVIPVIFVI